jgi:hypothetical protein
MVVGLKALMKTRHALVACNHELMGILLPSVQSVPLFLMAK